MPVGLSCTSRQSFGSNLLSRNQRTRSSRCPSVLKASKALSILHDRLGGVGRLVVITESPDGDTNRRFIAELGERLKARKPQEMRLLQADCKEETEWGRNRALHSVPPWQLPESLVMAAANVSHPCDRAGTVHPPGAARHRAGRCAPARVRRTAVQCSARETPGMRDRQGHSAAHRVHCVRW